MSFSLISEKSNVNHCEFNQKMKGNNSNIWEYCTVMLQRSASVLLGETHTIFHVYMNKDKLRPAKSFAIKKGLKMCSYFLQHTLFPSQHTQLVTIP